MPPGCSLDMPLICFFVCNSRDQFDITVNLWKKRDYIYEVLLCVDEASILISIEVKYSHTVRLLYG